MTITLSPRTRPLSANTYISWKIYRLKEPMGGFPAKSIFNLVGNGQYAPGQSHWPGHTYIRPWGPVDKDLPIALCPLDLLEDFDNPGFNKKKKKEKKMPHEKPIIIESEHYKFAVERGEDIDVDRIIAENPGKQAIVIMAKYSTGVLLSKSLIDRASKLDPRPTIFGDRVGPTWGYIGGGVSVRTIGEKHNFIRDSSKPEQSEWYLTQYSTCKPSEVIRDVRTMLEDIERNEKPKRPFSVRVTVF